MTVMARSIVLRTTMRPLSLGAALLVLMAPSARAQVVTKFNYDAGDHVSQITDPRGLVTSYTFDGLDQRWQQVSPDTGTTSFSYDGYGRLASMTRADGSQTAYGYDGINRRTSASASGLTQTLTFDSCPNGIGRLCAATDATGTTSYSYSPEGWLTGRGFSIGGTAYSLGYSYNSLGQVSTIVYPDGNQASYSYIEGVISTVQVKIGSTVVNAATGISYQPHDLAMAQWTSGNGLVNTLSYDTDGRLTGVSVPGVQNLGLSYDAANRITGLANGIDGAMTQDFGYDGMSRLTSVYSDADNEAFQYDANGNRINQVLNGVSATVAPSANSNQIMSLSGGVSTSYSYDAKGNLTTVSGVPTFGYDAFNRLSSAGSTTYYVSAEGKRLRKTVGGANAYFAPDIAGSLMAENPGSGWSDYVWLNGRLIGRVVGGQLQAIHDDQVGRPEAMTDSNQAIVWRARNFAFDRIVMVANAVPLNLGFPGQYYDMESGAWNNGFRDYSPALGGYLESDPLGEAAGVNTYAYALGNPVQRTDPSGLDSGYVLSGDIGSLMNGGRKAGGPFVFAAAAAETSLVGPAHWETESVAIAGYDGVTGGYTAWLSATGPVYGSDNFNVAALYGKETMSDGTTVPLRLYELNIGKGIHRAGKFGIGAGAFKGCDGWGFYLHITGGLGKGSGSIGYGVSP